MLCSKIKEQIDKMLDTVNNIEELSENKKILLQNLQNKYKINCGNSGTKENDDGNDEGLFSWINDLFGESNDTDKNDNSGDGSNNFGDNLDSGGDSGD